MVIYRSFYLVISLLFLYASAEQGTDNNTRVFNGENGGYADKTASRTKIVFDGNSADLETVGLKVGFAFSVRSRTLVDQSLQRCILPSHQLELYAQLLHLLTRVVENPKLVLPGYGNHQGLRNYLSNSIDVEGMSSWQKQENNERCAPYISRIEDIVFDKNGFFKEQLSYAEQLELAKVCVGFMQEFFPAQAMSMLKDLAQGNKAFAQLYRTLTKGTYFEQLKLFMGQSLKIGCFSGSEKRRDLISKRTCGDILGIIYKLCDEGRFDEACTLGQTEKIFSKKWFSKLEERTLFDCYPVLAARVQDALTQAAYQEQCIDFVQELGDSEYKEVFPCHDIAQVRVKACDEVIAHPDSLTCFHSINLATRWLFNSRYLTPDQTGILLDGNAYQHVLLDENIIVADICNELQPLLMEDARFDLLNNALIDSINYAVGFNKNGEIVKASHATDASWALLGCVKTGLELAHTAGVRIGIPFAHGVYQGLENTVDMIVHPVKTAQQFVGSVILCGKVLNKVGLGIIGMDVMYHLAPDKRRYLLRELESLQEMYQAAEHAISEAASTMTLESAVEHGATFATEMVCLHGIGKFFSFAGKNVSAIVRDALENFKAHEVAVTTEGILIPGEPLAEGMNIENEISHRLGQEVNSYAADFVEPVTSDIIGKGQVNIGQELQPLGRGNTGRAIPQNLHEQLVLEEIMSDPYLGKEIGISKGKGMTDKRWHKNDGWVKKAWHSNNIEVHYVAQKDINELIKAIDDFKFKQL